MFAVNQQYQQAAATTTSSGGLVWNGAAWVSAANAPSAGGHSTYSSQAYGAYTQQPQPAYYSAQPQPQTSSLVHQYTQFYHQWKSQQEQAEQRLAALLLTSPEREDVQRVVDWCKYYADQSSRAAHHYHSNPNQPPPFELPPAPYNLSAGTSVGSSRTAATTNVAQPQQPQPKQASHWGTQQPQKRQPPASNGNGNDDMAPPDGLKRYVHRCLQQCSTDQQRQTVQQEAEKVIAKSIQQGTLHTTNWDTVEPIPVPIIGVPKQQMKAKTNQSNNNNNSHYGPAVSNGHYGPAAAAASSSPSSSSFPIASHLPRNKKQQQQQQNSSKYKKRNSDDVSASSWNSDFMPLPGAKHKKQKKQHQSPKNDGFARNSQALVQRAHRFSGPGGMADAMSNSSKGIDDRYMGKGVIGGSQKKLDATDYEQMKVKGTCMKLEKQYLRLTAPPKPECVRPLPILQKHMANLKTEWKLPATKRRDYSWFCSELKAVRQDLTVQHIFSSFTVDVYETHARMALQEQDINEFNQAQTQLKILYGKLPDNEEANANKNEFIAYRTIYFVMMTLNQKYKGGSADMLNLMLNLTSDQKEDPAIQHALQVRAAVAEVNYHQFFRLWKKCPNLGGKLMGLMVPTMRHWTLLRLCKAYRPTAEVKFVLEELGFLTETDKDLDEGKKFLSSCGCLLNQDGMSINTKESVMRESDLQEKRSLI